MANAKSIHIGLNYVDPAAYNGWNGELFGCINDARDMQAIADGLGYQSLVLTDSDATSSRVICEIGQAASALSSGDILFLTYSGHGGQVDDVNGDEDEGLDETWCLWDRQLIDDELYCLWSRFAAGVRIVMLSDSCHSGTVARMMAALQELSRESRTRGGPTTSHASALNALSKAMGIETAKPRKLMSRAAPNATAGASPNPVTLDRPRRMPGDIQALVNNTRATAHAAAQWLAGASERASLGASVILISGCQDDQLSMDGAGNGLFTQRLKQVWDNGNFGGDYRAFWSEIKGLMPASQQPNYFTVGAANPTFEGQAPFEIGSGGGGSSAPQPQPQPMPTGPRPTLHPGATGPHVEYLQSRLADYGYYNGAADGSFGPMTASAVRSFQSACGLPADGVVGANTWAALG